ncbi:MAG: hypothetical protein QXU87_05215 [Candidatus Caldarchaeum sp.]
MANEAEIAFGIAALVYGAGLVLFSLPLPQFRRWGWTAMMHSWSTAAILSIVGSIALLKPVLAGYLQSMGVSLPLTATFDDAIASAHASRDMAFEWLKAVNLAAMSLGTLQSIVMLALLPAWLSGVGILLSAIASFIFGAVFNLLIFIAKLLSGVVVFMEGVVAFVGLAKGVAPTLFIIGAALFAIPFARTAGKTMMVLGAALTLALPVAIVAASPPPGYVEQSIMEAADIQKLSIASRAVGEMEGGVRYTVYDRENDTLWYPFLIAEFTQPPEIDRDKVCANLPRGGNLTCEQIIEIMRDVLKTPQKTIFDTGGGGYYNAYDEGYRMSLINGTYARRVWFLNMWVTLYDTSPRNITVHKVPEDPDPSAMACTGTDPDREFFFGGWDDGSISCNPYLIWKERWESFWRSTSLYNETSLWMVAANRNTTFVWFTEQPWGTKKEDLNIYGITLPKVRELRWAVNETYTCETDGNSSTTETCWRWHYYTRGDYSGNKSVYFVYLNMDDYDVCWHIDPIYGGPVNGTDVCERRLGTPSWSYEFRPSTSNPPTWNHTVLDSSFEEIMAAGFIDGYGPYTLPQSVEAIDRNEPLELNAPTQQKKVFVTANQTIIRDSYDGYPEVPDSLSYSFRVIFTASESMPYLPPVEWHKFDEDREYTRQLASGGYVPDNILGISVDNFRGEWARYQNFRQGLYRDGPSHEATRRINAALLTYREQNWETNATVFDTNIPLARTISETFYRNAYGAYAGSNIPISTLPILMVGSGSVAILKPLSELIGQAFAIGIAVGLLALIIDTFQSLVGGQSVMMHFFFSKVGNITHAAKFFTTYASAVKRMSRVDFIARWIQRRQENQLLKAATEAREKNRKAWEKFAERTRFSGVMERMLDKKRELEGRGGIVARAERLVLGVMTRSYTANVAMSAVRSDPKFAEAVRNAYAERLMMKGYSQEEAMRKADLLIGWAKQSRMVEARPEKVAQGFANMLKSSTMSQRIALVDSFAKSDFGKHVVGASLVEGILSPTVGKAADWMSTRLSASGHVSAGAFFGYISDQLDGKIRAPAAFSLAADNNPFTPEGVRPLVTPAYVPEFRTGILHPAGTAEQPVIKQHDYGGDPSDVKHAYDMHRSYGTPEDFRRFEERIGEYMWIVANPYDPDFRLTNLVDGGDRVVVETNMGTYEVSKNELDEFMKVMEEMGARMSHAAPAKGYDVSPADYQPDPGVAEAQQQYMDSLREKIFSGADDPRTLDEFFSVADSLGKREDAASFVERVGSESDGEFKVPWWTAGSEPSAEPQDVSEHMSWGDFGKKENDVGDTESQMPPEWRQAGENSNKKNGEEKNE